MPPAPTGVADYAAALAGALGDLARVVVNPDRSSDVELYHLGNNQLHAAIYLRALDRPGVAVLHDTVLHHLFLGSLEEREYVDEFVYNYGEWSRELAIQLWRDRSRSAQDPRYFHHPMLRRITETSRRLVVHNPAAAAVVSSLACGPDAVIEIPHLFRQPELPPHQQVEDLRVRLGVPPGATLFGVFGYLRESKRLMSVLSAFADVRRDFPEATLLVAGRFVSPDLERAVEPLLQTAGVRRVGYVPDSEFWLHASAVDACINLRYPAAGETSGIGVRLMGIGKAVLVTSGDEYARVPETACIRIDPGPAETEMLADYMRWLASSSDIAREIGRRAAAHIASEHSLDRCARLYLEALS